MLFLEFLLFLFFFFFQKVFFTREISLRTIDTKLSCETIGRDSTISSNCIDIYMHDLATVV